jgi:hypothetical protein
MRHGWLQYESEYFRYHHRRFHLIEARESHSNQTLLHFG